MKPSLYAVAGTLLCCSLLGCGGTPYQQNESAAKDTFKAMDDLTTILESVKDEKTAKEAAPKIDKISDRIEEIAKREIPKVSKEDEEKLTKLFEPEFKKMQNLKEITFKAAASSKGEATFKKAFERFDEATKKLQKAKKS